MTTELQDGDIVLVYARWPLSLIMRYQHAALLWSHMGRLYTVEAGPLSGVKTWRLGHWPMPFDVYRPVGANELAGQFAAGCALKRLGEGYGWMDVLRALWQRWAKPLQAMKVICSDLVVQSWCEVGVFITSQSHPLPDDIWRGQVELVGSYEGGVK